MFVTAMPSTSILNFMGIYNHKFSVLVQDAHEFLNFLLNELVDILEKESSAAKDSTENLPTEETVNGSTNGQANGVHKEPLATWVHKNFQVRVSIIAPLHVLPFIGGVLSCGDLLELS